MSRADSDVWKAKMTAGFASADVNGNGYITIDDLDAMLVRVAAMYDVSPDSPQFEEYRTLANAGFEAMIAALDKDSDARISLDEWLAYWGEVSDEDFEAYVNSYCDSMFVLSDADNDGRLDKDEYKRFVLASGNTNEEDAEAAFAMLDADGTGYISHDELARFMLEFSAGTDDDLPGNRLLGEAPLAG